MKLLIVDDNQRFRTFLRNLLTDIATDIEESDNGEEAVAAYGQTRPDIVLMDVRMGRMDGLTATHQIIAQDQSAKVIIVTSYNDEALRRLASEAGACGYAVKDDLQSLADLLRAAKSQLPKNHP